MDDICIGCEWNTGKECMNMGQSNPDPYGNSCQRVLELGSDLTALGVAHDALDDQLNVAISALRRIAAANSRAKSTPEFAVHAYNTCVDLANFTLDRLKR